MILKRFKTNGRTSATPSFQFLTAIGWVPKKHLERSQTINEVQKPSKSGQKSSFWDLSKNTDPGEKLKKHDFLEKHEKTYSFLKTHFPEMVTF
jgi:hypothetical protein